MHTVAALALPDVIAFDLATAVEVFGRASLPDGRPAYRVIVAGTSPTVDAGPLQITTHAGLDALTQADTIIVPGRNDAAAPLPDGLADALRAAAEDGTRIASICVGAFTLASAGLLDGMRATTHWLATGLLARRYPGIVVEADVLYTDNGRILTSAGAAAGLDLCLHMIRRDFGAAVAAHASRLAVAPLHRMGGQAQFIVRNPPTYRTASLEDVLIWVEENAHRRLTLSDVADAAHMSVRTLTRRFHQETGQAPMEWVAGVRIRHAQELLETTDHGVDRIALQTGFSSPSNFRAQFRRAVGVTPSEYRTTFGGRPLPQEIRFEPSESHGNAVTVAP
ncbi:helix-turn-helix domain-containing protein [Microbacterium sp. ARD32]|uniref:GlxA family transcriptional regulator n=1 Tax=Microbacterium sp. ARD32 TaxID=2962577 RepID=UPI0028822A98|nr:helix-turn-helix domain-containing protein [Microbacterium sp. ARD32]MDT0158777.1 helix-turn-helix domain-containing protein [Microbacterium sp. ARD32]